MVYFKADLAFPLFSKPRGKLGAYGNIYHSSKEYMSFKAQVKNAINSILPMNYPFSYPLGVALVNQFTPKKRGHEPDLLDNQLGALLDTLALNKFIEDDSRKYLRYCFTVGIESNVDHSVLWLFDGESRQIVLEEFLTLEDDILRSLHFEGYKTKYKF